MSIKVICPNGHSLRIKDKYAGKVGLCPLCEAPITVPNVRVFGDESIMDVLKPHESGLSIIPLRSVAAGDKSGRVQTQSLIVCRRCHRQIPAEADACPFCKAVVHPAE